MENNNRITTYIKYSFIIMIIMWFLSIFIISGGETVTLFEAIYSFLWIGITIFCFVNSIRGIRIPKIKKGFIITSLVISSILIFLFAIGFIVVVIEIILSGL